MKLIKLDTLNIPTYIIVDDYNTEEAYDSRITKGMPFYKDETKDINIAEYPPASKVSRPVIASTYKIEGLPLLDINQIKELLNREISLQDIIDKRNTSDRYDETKKRYNYSENDIKEIVDEYKFIKNNSDNKFTKADLFVFVGFFNEKRKLGISSEQILKDFEVIIQEINNSKSELDVEIEMEKSRYVISGGLIPDGEIGGKGLQTHWYYKPKINKQGFITVTKIN